MPQITSIGDAKVAIAMIAGTLPEPTNEHISKAIAEPSPVVTIMDSIEALYAMEEKTNPVRELLIELLNFVVPYSFHGINDENRGTRIIQVMQRELGQTQEGDVNWIDPENDPAVADKFMPIEPPAPVEETE